MINKIMVKDINKNLEYMNKIKSARQIGLLK
jgi:hypothetical protein